MIQQNIQIPPKVEYAIYLFIFLINIIYFVLLLNHFRVEHLLFYISLVIISFISVVEILCLKFAYLGDVCGHLWHWTRSVMLIIACILCLVGLILNVQRTTKQSLVLDATSEINQPRQINHESVINQLNQSRPEFEDALDMNLSDVKNINLESTSSKQNIDAEFVPVNNNFKKDAPSSTDIIYTYPRQSGEFLSSDVDYQQSILGVIQRPVNQNIESILMLAQNVINELKNYICSLVKFYFLDNFKAIKNNLGNYESVTNESIGKCLELSERLNNFEKEILKDVSARFINKDTSRLHSLIKDIFYHLHQTICTPEFSLNTEEIERFILDLYNSFCGIKYPIEGIINQGRIEGFATQNVIRSDSVLSYTIDKLGITYSPSSHHISDLFSKLSDVAEELKKLWCMYIFSRYQDVSERRNKLFEKLTKELDLDITCYDYWNVLENEVMLIHKMMLQIHSSYDTRSFVKAFRTLNEHVLRHVCLEGKIDEIKMKDLTENLFDTFCRRYRK